MIDVTRLFEFYLDNSTLFLRICDGNLDLALDKNKPPWIKQILSNHYDSNSI